MTIQVTKQQRANALEALNVMWPSVPPENVYRQLNWWRGDFEKASKPPTCRSVACFGGWCAWWPSFRKQGVTVGDDGAPTFDGGYASDVAKQLFGDRDLFNLRRFRERGTDHEVVSKRLCKLIRESVVA